MRKFVPDMCMYVNVCALKSGGGEQTIRESGRLRR